LDCKKPALTNVCALSFATGNDVNPALAFLILVFGLVAVAVLSYFLYHHSFWVLTKKRQKVLSKICNAAGAERDTLIERAFELLDEDNSGFLDIDEMTIMMISIYPKLTKKAAKEKIQLFLEEHDEYNDELDYEGFKEMLLSCISIAPARKSSLRPWTSMKHLVTVSSCKPTQSTNQSVRAETLEALELDGDGQDNTYACA